MMLERSGHINFCGFFSCLLLRLYLRNFSYLILGTGLLCSGQSTSNLQWVTVYPGYENTKDFTLFNNNVTWKEAYSHCIQHGGGLSALHSNPYYVYLKNAALENGWDPDIPIWVGGIKDPLTEKWLAASSCVDLPGLIINGGVTGEQQCLMLDMASSNTDIKNLYAQPCDTLGGYSCYHDFDSIYAGSSVFNTYENMTLSEGILYSTEIIPTLHDCVTSLFVSCFHCYAAEYNHPEKKCYRYSKLLTQLPVQVSIEQSLNHQTLILKNANRVYISDKTIGSGSTILQYPCLMPPSTDFSTEGFTTGTTDAATTISTNGKTKSTDATTKESTPTYISTMESTTRTCPCNCSSNYVNKTKEVILFEMEARRRELIIEKKILSAHTRTKISAADDRVSAGTMGYIGGAVLGLSILFISLGDIITVISILYTFACK